MDALEAKDVEGGVRFSVRVAPRASRTAIQGVVAGKLKVALTSPPTDGAANQALVKLLSKRLHVPQRAVEIVVGARSRDKILRVQGVSVMALRKALENV